eukprot:scaffold95135_cov46-Prasinocladus_malaysianus.AAC.1
MSAGRQEGPKVLKAYNKVLRVAAISNLTTGKTATQSTMRANKQLIRLGQVRKSTGPYAVKTRSTLRGLTYVLPWVMLPGVAHAEVLKSLANHVARLGSLGFH